MSNYTTVIEAVQAPVAPVWFVSTIWQTEPLDEMIDRTRSSDGRWLKRNVKLNSPVIAFSDAKMAMAEQYDCEPEMLFMSRR